MVNRLSEYITGMKMTRQLLLEAKINASHAYAHGGDMLSLIRSVNNLIGAFDAFVAATTCVVSIKDGKRPKTKRRSR
jgi:hypothetical protein